MRAAEIRKERKNVKKKTIPRKIPPLLITFQRKVIGGFRETLGDISELMRKSREADIHFTERDLRSLAEKGQGSLVRGIKIKKSERAEIARSVGNFVNALDHGKAEWKVV